MSIVRDQGWQFDSQRTHHMWLGSVLKKKTHHMWLGSVLKKKKRRKKIEVTDLCEIDCKYCM